MAIKTIILLISMHSSSRSKCLSRSLERLRRGSPLHGSWCFQWWPGMRLSSSYLGGTVQRTISWGEQHLWVRRVSLRRVITPFQQRQPLWIRLKRVREPNSSECSFETILSFSIRLRNTCSKSLQQARQITRTIMLPLLRALAMMEVHDLPSQTNFL